MSKKDGIYDLLPCPLTSNSTGPSNNQSAVQGRALQHGTALLGQTCFARSLIELAQCQQAC